MKYDFIISKNILIIIFFLIYFIFSFHIPWLLLNEPSKFCSNFYLIKTLSNDSCLQLQKSDYFKVVKLSVLWILFFIFTLKLLLKIKFFSLEKIINKFLKKKSIINISHNQIIFITMINNFIILSSYIILVPQFFFLQQLCKFLNLFLTLYFFRKKNYLFLFLNNLIFLLDIYFGEISKLIFLFITLNLYYLLEKKNVSLFYFIKISFFFFICFILLVTTQRKFIENYGFSTHTPKWTLTFNTNDKFYLFYTKKDNSELKIKENYFDIESYNKILYLKKEEDSFISPFPINSRFNYDYQRALNRISDLKISTYVIYLIDNNYLNTYDGKTYSNIPYKFIPRFIFPNKPKELFGNILTCDFGIGWNDYEDNEDCKKRNLTSVNLNIFLESYINFKYLGLFLSSFAFAIIVGTVIFFTNNKNNLMNYFSICLFYQSIHYSSNFSGVFGGLIISFLLLIIFLPLKRFNE